MFIPAFPLNRVTGPRDASRFSTISGSSAGSTPRTDQARTVMWSHHLLPEACWSRGRTIVDEFSLFGKVARHSGLYEFHFVRRCHVVNSSRKSIRAACTWDSTLSVITPRFMNMCEDRNKTDSFAVFERSHFVTTHQWSSRRAAFALPVRVSDSLLRRSWIPPQGT